MPWSSQHGWLRAVHVQFVTRLVTKPATRLEAGDLTLTRCYSWDARTREVRDWMEDAIA